MCSYDGGTEEEDGYAPKGMTSRVDQVGVSNQYAVFAAGIVPKVTSNKNRQVRIIRVFII